MQLIYIPIYSNVRLGGMFLNKRLGSRTFPKNEQQVPLHSQEMVL